MISSCDYLLCSHLSFTDRNHDKENCLAIISEKQTGQMKGKEYLAGYDMNLAEEI